MTPAIEVERLARTYITHEGNFRTRRREVAALRGIDLVVQLGDLFGLLGPNGAGKTTLVKILATLLLPTSGQARVLGCDVARETGAVRGRIGLVFGGDRGFYSRLSVRDNLVYWSALYRLPRREALQRAQAVLDLMQLGPVADRAVETLSRGMRQRLHLARGLLPNPALLLLDEPTIGLDPVAARALREIIRDLRRDGVTVFLTTHYMQEAEELCDRVAIIDGGEIRYEGTTADLKQRVSGGNTLRLVLGACDEARLRAIGAWPAVRSLESEEREGRLHVTVAYTGDASLIGQVVRHLEGVEIVELHSRELTLEDAYVGIIGERGMALAGN
jgi:ABC-2 type transport system ATP-binding protein